MNKMLDDLLNGPVRGDIFCLLCGLFMILFLSVVSQITVSTTRSQSSLVTENTALKAELAELKIQASKTAVGKSSEKPKGERTEVYVRGDNARVTLVALKRQGSAEPMTTARSMEEFENYILKHPISGEVSLIASGGLAVSRVSAVRDLILRNGTITGVSLVFPQ